MIDMILKNTILLFIVGCMPITTTSAQQLGKQEDDRPKITISKETTYFTEPLNEHGEVDYWKALNTHYSKGVTPENNIVTAIMALSGTTIKDAIARERLLQRLVMTNDQVPTETALIRFSKFVKSEFDFDEIIKIDDAITSRPWARDDYPKAAAWIDKYSPAVDQYINKLKHKSRYFYPFVSAKEGERMVVGSESDLEGTRTVVEFLMARSQLRLNDNNPTGCMSDLLAIRKTVYLKSHGHTLVDLMLAYACAGMCHGAEVQFCIHKSTTAMHLEQYRREVKKYVLPNRIPEIVRTTDRVTLLQIALGIKNGDVQAIKLINDQFDFDFALGKNKVVPEEVVVRSVRRIVDWDEVLKCVNQLVEKYAKVLEPEPTYQSMLALEKFEDDEWKKQEEYESVFYWYYLLMSDGQEKNRRLAEAIEYRPSILGAVPSIYKFFISKRTNERLLDTLIALRIYKDEHGEFPDELKSLTPRYCKSVPLDPYSGKPLIYKKQGDHFLLYSIGRNRVDDGGELDQAGTDFTVTSDPQLWASRYDYE